MLATYIGTVMAVVAIWWGSTVLLLHLVSRPVATHRLAMVVGTALAVVAAAMLWRSTAQSDLISVMASMVAGVIIWGWHELSFLTGYVTGPRRMGAGNVRHGFRHFANASMTLIYHELAILVTAAILVIGTWGEVNQAGTYTFLILWVMRLSAKLNIFLGVPNLSEELLPDHLRYLSGYFRNAPMNLLFPLSVTLATALMTALGLAAYHTELGSAASFTLTMLATLTALGLLEHWLLVLPVADERMWRWALHSGKTDTTVQPHDLSTSALHKL